MNDGEYRMSLSSLKCALQPVTASLLLFAFPLTLWGQDAQTTNSQGQNATASESPRQSALPQTPSNQHPFVVKDYSKPKRPFPNVIAPYTPQHVPPPDLSNTPRILQLMRDGKIYLSMDDAVA